MLGLHVVNDKKPSGEKEKKYGCSNDTYKYIVMFDVVVIFLQKSGSDRRLFNVFLFV